MLGELAAARSRQLIAEAVAEKDWQAQIVDYASLRGWWVYHPHDSRRSTAGWLDLTMIRPPRIVFAELKTERGRVTREQKAMIARLGLCDAEVFLWRPSDWAEVEQVLR